MMATLNQMNSEAEALKLDRKNKEALAKYNETMKKIEEFHRPLAKGYRFKFLFERQQHCSHRVCNFSYSQS